MSRVRDVAQHNRELFVATREMLSDSFGRVRDFALSGVPLVSLKKIHDLPSSSFFFDSRPECLHRLDTIGGNVKSVIAFWNKRQKVGYVKDHNGFFELWPLRAIQKGTSLRARVPSQAPRSQGTRSHCLKTQELSWPCIGEELQHHQQSHRMLALLHQSARDP